jgi:hypothetical protein
VTVDDFLISHRAKSLKLDTCYSHPSRALTIAYTKVSSVFCAPEQQIGRVEEADSEKFNLTTEPSDVRAKNKQEKKSRVKLITRNICRVRPNVLPCASSFWVNAESKRANEFD